MQEDKDFSLDSLSGLPLTGVEVFGFDEGVDIDTITFDFAGRLVSVSVNRDDDTLMWFDGPVFPVYEGQVRKSQDVWRRLFGMPVICSWNMVNQNGYQDAAQFTFGPGGGQQTVQLMAMASDILVFLATAETVTA